MSDSLQPWWTVTHKAPLSMGFSRQEYWNWLPCPPPGDLPNPGIKPRSPELQADSFPSEPPGKPKNTRIGSLHLLQGSFPTQESNQALLHCRWILCQLSYQESPNFPYPELYLGVEWRHTVGNLWVQIWKLALRKTFQSSVLCILDFR